MINPELKLKYLIKFYNAVSQRSVESIQEIPEEVLTVLSSLDYLELIKPFVRHDIVNAGMTRRQIQIKYHLGVGQAITIGRVLGLYQGNNKKRETCSGHPLQRLLREVSVVMR